MRMTTIATLLFLAVCTGACDFHLAGGCVDTIKSTSVSPGGSIEAVVVETNCGATTPFYTSVHLRKVGEQLASRSADAVTVSIGKPEVALDWQDAGTLRICWPKDAEVRKLNPAWREIRVSYEGCPQGKDSTE